MTKITIFLVIIGAISYLLGSANGAIITSSLLFRRDVRKYGSGNAGLTNFGRTFGFKKALLVVLIDVLKTVISMVIGGLLLKGQGYEMVGKLFAGFCVMFAHAYPVWYGFKGGKGILCGGTVAWMVDFRVGLICWSVFLILVIFTRYVSLGSIMACVSLPIAMLVFKFPTVEIVLGLLCGLLSIFAHRENIGRLIKGNENKLSIGGKEKYKK